MCKNEIKAENEKDAVNSAIQFPKNLFYGLWSSQRPPTSVRVKITVTY